MGYYWHQHVAEFYSPQRLIHEAHRRGLCGIFSLDIKTGWDFHQEATRDLSIRILDVFLVMFLMLSPPCTAFSRLMHMWNYKKMSPEDAAMMWEGGMCFLEHSMQAAAAQVAGNRYFAFEHPASASSWHQPCVQAVAAMPGVEAVVFDQCMLGLVTKVSHTPTRKRTRVLTNCPKLALMLSHFKCDRLHKHERIQGAEGGVKRSLWAQFYPLPFVKVLVDGAVETLALS